jgi:hypothetical protein
MYTLQCEGTPHFHRSNMPQIISTLHALDLPFDQEAAYKRVQHPTLDPALLDVLLDVTCTSTLFSDIPSARKVDLYLFQELLVSICYRLLAIPHSHSPPRIEDAYHVGLTIFMMSLFLQIGSQRVMNYNNVTKRLKNILEGDILESEDGLKFWLLMLGGVWVTDDDNVEWLIPMMFTQRRKMQLCNWSEAKEVLERWMWIGVLHDGPGRMVWERAR